MSRIVSKSIAELVARYANEIPCGFVFDLADLFKQLNPNFDRDKFFEACHESDAVREARAIIKNRKR